MNALAERDATLAERDQLIELNDRLRRLLRKAQGFEAKSERLAKLDPDQLNLALEDLEQGIAKAEAIEEKTATTAPRKRRINRGSLPAHLPRIHEREGLGLPSVSLLIVGVVGNAQVVLPSQQRECDPASNIAFEAFLMTS